VFKTVSEEPGVATVQVERVVTSDTPATKRHDPGHPLADANGDVWEAGVDTSAELVEMVESARMYQNNVQVLQTAKSLLLETIRLGK
jgi:flagellar basal-body rod protein FlgC